MSAGKGDAYRSVDKKKFDSNYDAIFGKKNCTVNTQMYLFLQKIIAERNRQDAKWGTNDQHDLHKWNTILNEEVGEVANAILEGEMDNLEKELVQVAAVALKILERVF